jgi:hypothetical protein
MMLKIPDANTEYLAPLKQLVKLHLCGSRRRTPRDNLHQFRRIVPEIVFPGLRGRLRI